MTANSSSLQLLQVEADPTSEEDSYLRLLHNNKHIKYVTIAAGIYSSHDMCFAPTITALLEPLLPPGIWNYGYINKDPETGLPHFAEFSQKEFPSVSNAWHPIKVDYLDLVLGGKLMPGVYDATCSQFTTPLVAKFASYQWIEGHNIGPRFLGHITEEGRVIGFLMERVADETGNARHPTPADLEVCQQALAKLHDLGILHGDLVKYNILVTSKGAILIDFSTARKSDDSSAFEQEKKSLEAQLCSESDRGRPGGRFLEGRALETYVATDDGTSRTHRPADDQ